MALWGVYAVFAFFLIWNDKDFADDWFPSSLLVSAISTLSFAIGNALALLDLRKNAPWVAWRPSYTAAGILISVLGGIALGSFSTGGIFGIIAIVIMRSMYGPPESQRQRTAKDIGV